MKRLWTPGFDVHASILKPPSAHAEPTVLSGCGRHRYPRLPFEFQEWGIVCSDILHFPPSPSCTSLQLCTLKRILRDVICSPDPNSRAFYIVHDRVLGDEMLERIRSVRSLTDDTIEMKYMSAPSDL